MPQVCAYTLLIPEGNLKLADHSAGAFDLPATETLPSGRCCCVHYQGLAREKEGWGGSQAPLSVFPSLVLLHLLRAVTHIPPACALVPGRIDPYGFERPHDYESYKDMMDEYVVILNRRSRRWSKLLQEKPQVEKNVTGRERFWRPLLLLLWRCDVRAWKNICVCFVK